jgi:hypothetical protein
MRFLASFIVAATVILLPANSRACSCRGLAEYDAVFEGNVTRSRTDQKNPSHYHEAHFTITRNLHGKIARRVIVYSPLPVLMCGVTLEAGKRYIVYAVRVGGKYETRDCYGTKELPAKRS